MDDMTRIRRTMLRRSIYVLLAPVVMILAALACAGTPLTGMPLFVCPTDAPLPTATTLPGTATPTPAPTATPYFIVPPADFYLGDPVTVGAPDADHAARFRLLDVGDVPAGPDADGSPQKVYTWSLEVTNTGRADYEIYPALHMILSAIRVGGERREGTWPATREAAEVAGMTPDDAVYTLRPGQTQTFRFAAFGPAGEAAGFTFQLDPTVSAGSGVITWVPVPNPYCEP